MSNVKSDMGFGFRFNNQRNMVMRVDTGFSKEGFQVRVAFDKVFYDSGAGGAIVAGRVRKRHRHSFRYDPIQVMPPPKPVEKVRVHKIDQAFDFIPSNSVQWEPRPPVPAGAVNTLGEPPDNAWFTNRHGLQHRMTREELQRGLHSSRRFRHLPSWEEKRKESPPDFA